MIELTLMNGKCVTKLQYGDVVCMGDYMLYVLKDDRVLIHVPKGLKTKIFKKKFKYSDDGIIELGQIK